jgi:hypothetical protein
MQSPGMLRCCVALVRTEILGEHITSIIRLTRIGERGTTLAVTSNQSKLRRNARFLATTNTVPSSPTLRHYVTLFLHSMLHLLVIVNVPSSPIVTLMMEAIHSSNTLVLTRVMAYFSLTTVITSNLTLREGYSLIFFKLIALIAVTFHDN